MSNNGSDTQWEPPLKCWTCGMTREQVLEQYGGYIILPGEVPSLMKYICPQCHTLIYNENCYELTKMFIAKQHDEPRIIRPNQPKVVQLTPKFK